MTKSSGLPIPLTMQDATGNSTIIPKIHKSAILSYNILLI